MAKQSPEYYQTWRLEHREERLAYNREWKRTHPEAVSRSKRKAKYGITDVQYNTLLLAQCGRCAICTEILTEPHVDHDHVTGHIRGLLCELCNRGLGFFKDNPEALRFASDFLMEKR